MKSKLTLKPKKTIMVKYKGIKPPVSKGTVAYPIKKFGLVVSFAAQATDPARIAYLLDMARVHEETGEYDVEIVPLKITIKKKGA